MQQTSQHRADFATSGSFNQWRDSIFSYDIYFGPVFTTDSSMENATMVAKPDNVVILDIAYNVFDILVETFVDLTLWKFLLKHQQLWIDLLLLTNVTITRGIYLWVVILILR